MTCTCPPFVSAEPGDCAVHAPRTADGTCECGHPWFDHDSRGCQVNSFLTGPCPCRRTGPASAVDETATVVTPPLPLELMDSGLQFAARLPADVWIGGRRQDFDLPVWKDESGDIRIGLPKFAPEHGADIDQIVVSLDELLIAIGGAVG